MKVVAVIPARYGSKRLPGKPLLQARGKPLIQHVWEGVKKAEGLEEVWIATDDERILEAAAAFGAEAVLTREDHPSGTDRVHEAVSKLPEPPDAILNIQGDEPTVGPAEVEALLALLREKPEADWATLAAPGGPEAAGDPSRVKVVVDPSGFALYFSRAAIPHTRDGPPEKVLVHQGLYGYRREALERFVSLPPSPLERAERLEQLRALEAGMRIAVGVIGRALESIDTPEDYRDFLGE
jgi:3-deoxy-manno-octulosonate cytidylyltransferase (CMP-KDO synthetase)